MIFRPTVRSLIFVLTLTAATPVALAQQTDKAAAEALLSQGIELKKAGKYADACPKLEESLHLYPSINTEYHLADCYELSGKVASAWIDFLEVADKAHTSGEAAKESKARERAAALAGKVSRLTITVGTPDLAGLEVTRNNVPVGKATWGTALPLDPGTYVIEATAPGKESFKGEVQIGADGANKEVAIPALKEASASVVTPPIVAPSTNGPTPTSGTTSTVSDTPSTGSTQRTIGLIVGGAGLVSMGVGGILGLSAKSAYNGASCNGDACDQAGLDARNAARSKAGTATIFFALGAVALVGGGVLWLTAPSATKSTATATGPTLRAGLTFGGVLMTGSF